MRKVYKVGYGHPPKHSRFQKGRSGNPKGRPKGSRNFKTDVKETLDSPVPLREKGRTRNVSTQRAALLRLREQALGGNARALDRLLELARAYDDEDLPEAAAALAPSDDAILKSYLRRHGVPPPERPDGQGAEPRRRRRKRLAEQPQRTRKRLPKHLKKK